MPDTDEALLLCEFLFEFDRDPLVFLAKVLILRAACDSAFT